MAAISTPQYDKKCQEELEDTEEEEQTTQWPKEKLQKGDTNGAVNGIQAIHPTTS